MALLKDVLAKNIVHYRELRKFSQTGLAEKMEVSRNTVILYEKAETGVSVEMIANFANALQVEESDLLFAGQPPEAIVIEPMPLEALKIVEAALHAQKKDKLFDRVVVLWREFRDDEQRRLAIASLEDVANVRNELGETVRKRNKPSS